MKKTMIFRDEKGFTLIEIIAVLVIMGILAAVAVPKFFDLQERAKEKALYTAVSEVKVRVNQWFASQLLDGKPLADITYTAGSVDLELSDDFEITNWVVGGTDIAFTMTYFPDPSDHLKNPLVSNMTILKPKTES